MTAYQIFVLEFKREIHVFRICVMPCNTATIWIKHIDTHGQILELLYWNNHFKANSTWSDICTDNTATGESLQQLILILISRYCSVNCLSSHCSVICSIDRYDGKNANGNDKMGNVSGEPEPVQKADGNCPNVSIFSERKQTVEIMF